MVINDLSLKDNLSTLDHISPNNTSSFKEANLGANSPNESLPHFKNYFLFLLDIYLKLLSNKYSAKLTFIF